MTVEDLYAADVTLGRLREDKAQHRVVKKLSELNLQLQQRRKKTWANRWLSAPPPPQSLYIHGEVGRGKTMLMDLFYNAQTGIAKKRVHFHAFMQQVHHQRQSIKNGDVLLQIAQTISSQADLLCLDELQITDIADAMILGRLFQHLLDRGTVVVTTANLSPDQLYRDGLNRSLFLPTIALIKQRFDVMSLTGDKDYRLGHVKAEESFVFPLSPASDNQVQSVWERLTGSAQGLPLVIDVLGRQLAVPQAAHGCARFDFADLCQKPLSSADYLALAHNFQTIFIEHIPALTPDQRNEAKRFILAIDTFYDNRLRLVASAATAPELIYPRGDHHHEFARTVSRLQEMQSANWWADSLKSTISN